MKWLRKSLYIAMVSAVATINLGLSCLIGFSIRELFLISPVGFMILFPMVTMLLILMTAIANLAIAHEGR